MRFCIVLSLIISLTLGCSQSTNRAYRPPPAVETAKEVPSTPTPRSTPEKPPVIKKPEPRLPPPTAPTRFKFKKPIPTHLHAQDRSVMVLVPAGTYQVSTSTAQNSASPLQAVTLPAFYIDRTEITVGTVPGFQFRVRRNRIHWRTLVPAVSGNRHRLEQRATLLPVGREEITNRS